MLKKILKYLVTFFLGFCFLLPFLIMVLSSFKVTTYAALDPLFWLPTDPSWSNFAYLFRNDNFLRWIFNSIVVTVIPVFSQMFFAAILGYIFARKQFVGREIIFWTFMAVIMIPS